MSHVLLKNDKEIFEGTVNECWIKLQKIQPMSWDHAVKHGGYKVIKKND